jgi:Domain of unknown function (DUF4190)
VSVEQSVQRTSGYAIASLVLGIAGFFVIPLIPSILAIIFGQKAKDEIRTNPAIAGDGLATAGVVLGWIGVALVALGLLVLVLVLGAVA